MSRQTKEAQAGCRSVECRGKHEGAGDSVVVLHGSQCMAKQIQGPQGLARCKCGITTEKIQEVKQA